jgi:hypothetical protein
MVDICRRHYNICYSEHFGLYLFVIRDIMGDRTTIILPKLERILIELGENIKLARLRRKLTSQQVCERAAIGRNTLWMIEKGSSTVSMGAYAQVLFTLGMEQDLLKLAADDVVGRRLQDAGLETKKRGPKKK